MVRELDLVGEIAHEEDATAAVFLDILLSSWIGQVIGVEAVAWSWTVTSILSLFMR